MQSRRILSWALALGVIFLGLCWGGLAFADRLPDRQLFIDGKETRDIFEVNGEVYVSAKALSEATGIRFHKDEAGNVYLGKMPDFCFVSEKELELAGLKLGDPVDRAAALWDKPIRHEEDFSLQSFAADIYGKDNQDLLRVESDGIGITGVILYSPLAGQTVSGIEVGDPLTKVYEIYGRPHKVEESGMMVYYDAEGWYSLFFVPLGEDVGAIGMRSNFI